MTKIFKIDSLSQALRNQGKMKRLLVLSATLTLVACSVSEQPSYNQTNATAAVETSQKSVVQRMLTGHVTGDASANQSLNLVWSDGAVNNITSTDATGRYQITLPQQVELPVILETEGGNPLKVIVNRFDQNAEISPMSTMLVETLVGEYVNSEGAAALGQISDHELAATTQTVIDKVFGGGLTQEDMTTHLDLNKVLMTALQNMAQGQSALDLLRGVVGGSDASTGGNLLTNTAFQTLLAGAFASQNFSAADVMSLLSATSINPDVVDSAAQNALSFDVVKELAQNNDVNADVVNTIIEEASKVASDVLKNTSQEDMSNLLGKVLDTVSPALVDMVSNTLPAEMDNAQVAEIIQTTANQASKVLSEQTGDDISDISDEQLNVIKDQLGDVATLVSGPVAEILTGTVLENLSQEQTATVIHTIGDNLGEIAGTFFDQLGQGALPQDALAQATLASAPVAETIGSMLIEETVQNASPEIITNLIKTVGQISLNQLNATDSQATDSTDMVEILNVVAGALTAADLGANDVINQVSSQEQSQVIVDTLVEAASALVGLTQEGSLDTQDTVSGANLIENVVNVVLPVMMDNAGSTESSTETTAPAQEITQSVVSNLIDSAPEIIEAIDSQDMALLAENAQQVFDVAASLFGPAISESVDATDDSSDTVQQDPSSTDVVESDITEETAPALFTLVVDGEETTVVEAIATVAQDMFFNIGQQAFGALFSSSTES